MNKVIVRRPSLITGVPWAAARPRPVLAWPSRGLGRQVAEPDQVVGGGDEEELPLDPVAATVPQLAEAADGLHPPEDFFHALAHALTHDYPGCRVVRPSIALRCFCATCGVMPSCRASFTQPRLS